MNFVWASDVLFADVDLYIFSEWIEPHGRVSAEVLHEPVGGVSVQQQGSQWSLCLPKQASTVTVLSITQAGTGTC